jgi:hypothetical protein
MILCVSSMMLIMVRIEFRWLRHQLLNRVSRKHRHHARGLVSHPLSISWRSPVRKRIFMYIIFGIVQRNDTGSQTRP